MRKNDANQRDHEEWVGDDLICRYKPPSKESFRLHRRNCSKCSEEALKIGEYVKCPYCNYASSNITRHLKKKHKLSKEEIEEKKITTISLKYSERLSKSVSESILNNPEERKRRSELLGALNKTELFREKASKTAIRTSKDPEIVKQRTENLRKWRRQNPEIFREKCTTPMLKKLSEGPKKTKAEHYLGDWLKQHIKEKEFRYGGQLRSKEYETLNKSGRKQIDFVSLDRTVFIELDGPFHFEEFDGRQDVKLFEKRKVVENIQKTIKKDKITEELIRKKEKCLIRISYENWNQKGRIDDEVLEQIKTIIEERKKGIFYFGKAYKKHYKEKNG